MKAEVTSMNQWEGKVLVTGAAGYLGRRIVTHLLDRGIPVRALVRRAEQADSLRRQGAEVVVGDVTDKATLAPTLAGVAGVISAVGVLTGNGSDSPDAVDFQGNANLIDLAVQAKVRHFVLISVIGAQYLRTAAIFSAKFHAEQYLRQSGLTWTILRGGGFMPTYAQAWERGGKAGRYDVVGNANKPIYMISPDDLAELAVRSLWESGARAKTLDVTTDEVMTASDVAAIHSRLFNRPIHLRRLPTLLLKIARVPLKQINPAAADFLGFLQAVGEHVMDGRPTAVQQAFPGFAFEGYEAYLTKTKHHASDA